jgi:ABC-type polysaccharide/polyol phosphate transport system ATPase subunit
MEKETAIKIEHLSKTFRIPHEKITSMKGAFVNLFRKRTFEEFQALNDVSLEIKKGEFFGIIGRNGSGKSTLLKILAGIYKPDEGNIEIKGLISPFLELGIGFNPDLSGRDNIYLNGTVLGLTKKQIDEKFDEIVAFSELERFIDQKLKNYSSGMQVRLAFSVAIHAHRDILLMDEVLAVGDINFREKCLQVFRNLKNEGKTILLVSHDSETVNEFCDRAMLLNEGKVIICDNPEKTVFEYNRLLMNARNIIRQETGRKKITAKKDLKDKAITETSVLKKTEVVADNITAKEPEIIKENYFKKIGTYNSKGEEINVFVGGDDLIIKIEVEINKLDSEIYLSVGIFDKITRSIVCGNNMYFENIFKDWKSGHNEVQLIFRNNLFNKGDFYLTSKLFKGRPADKLEYDYFNGMENNQYFRVTPKNRHHGLTHLPHEWKV